MFNSQQQCGFLRLPGEIRNMIYRLALTSSSPIVDPANVLDISTRSEHQKLPHLGTSLLHTCHLIHNEVDFRPLYSENTFRFTSPAYAHEYITSLPPAFASLITDVEIDVRDISHQLVSPRSLQWSQYLSSNHGQWVEKLGSLRTDFPSLRTLRLNFETWPRIGLTRKHLWDILRRFLINLEGLDRIVLTGASKGAFMESKDPWSPLHYVGTSDVDVDDLVEKMWATVGGKETRRKGDNVIMWKRFDGKVQLEVVSRSALRKASRRRFDRPAQANKSGVWPASGYCGWVAYQEHKKASASKASAYVGFNPIFAV